MLIMFIVGGLITFLFIRTLKKDRIMKQKYYIDPAIKANQELRAELDKLRKERENGK